MRMSWPPAPVISNALSWDGGTAAIVLSGNRNFEGRVSPDVRANFLASPPLVVAYAIKGTVTEDMEASPPGTDGDGADVFLKDIWPTNQEVRDLIDANIDNEMRSEERRVGKECVSKSRDRWAPE